MCTAVTLSNKDFFFGRTLDLDRSYGEEVVITPGRYPMPLRHRPSLTEHYAVIGMAHVANGFPLYYDAVNEFGLCMAGLNFPGFAKYGHEIPDMDNVASFEFLPYVLMSCRCIEEAKQLLKQIQVTSDAFAPELPATPLHWILADETGCITVESLAEGLRIHENPVGVLTNNPPFDDQMFQLRNFMHLSSDPPRNRFAPETDLRPYSNGMGAIGLPGDLSSQSRFVRAAFTKLNSLCSEKDCVSQFFHILDTVSQCRGSNRLGEDNCEITRYTSCYNASKGICYHTTYDNRRISAVALHREDLSGKALIRFPLQMKEDVLFLNG